MTVLRFELSGLTEYTRESIIDEIKRVAALLPDEQISLARFCEHGRVGANTVRRRFGTWQKALEAAGLAHRSTGKDGVRGPQRSKRLTDEEVLEELRATARRLGADVLTLDDIRQHSFLGQRTFARRFGGFQNAVKAAGLQVSKMGSRYSDEQCFRNLLEVWTHYGRPPQHKEMSFPPSTVGAKAYVSRFGSWRKALAAFVAWTERDEEQPPPAMASEPMREPRASAQADRRGPRDVPWGLRFKVLHRDRFKCVLCGDHPATNPSCKLHVDHLVPWSKGGATAFENLRTLCETCNVGRGNRYDGSEVGHATLESIDQFAPPS